jgi:hypothetical protein
MNKYVKKLFELFDTKGYRSVKYDVTNRRYIYEFRIDGYDYKCYLNNMIVNSYYLSFCLIDKDNGIEIFKLINDENSSKFKVLGIVRNIVDEFIKKKNVDFLGFVSLENERQWIYLNYGKYLSRTHNMNLYGIEKRKGMFYWVVKKNLDEPLLKTYEKELFSISDNGKNK